MILDPADPTWDVGNGTAWRWDVLAKEAESCLNQRCFLLASGAPERPWEGPVSERTPGPPGLTLMCQGLWSATVGAMGVSPSSGLGEEHLGLSVVSPSLWVCLSTQKFSQISPHLGICPALHQDPHLP